jgi:hypothetical protein
MKSKISFRLLLSLYVPTTFVPFLVVNYPSQITDLLTRSVGIELFSLESQTGDVMGVKTAVYEASRTKQTTVHGDDHSVEAVGFVRDVTEHE